MSKIKLPLVYLAGQPKCYLDWKKSFYEIKEINCYDPFTDSNQDSPETFFPEDIKGISNSDFLVAHPGIAPSEGTWIEIGYFLALNTKNPGEKCKNIIIIWEDIRLPIWSKPFVEQAGTLVSTIDEALIVLKQLLTEKADLDRQKEISGTFLSIAHHCVSENVLRYLIMGELITGNKTKDTLISKVNKKVHENDTHRIWHKRELEDKIEGIIVALELSDRIIHIEEVYQLNMNKMLLSLALKDAYGILFEEVCMGNLGYYYYEKRFGDVATLLCGVGEGLTKESIYEFAFIREINIIYIQGSKTKNKNYETEQNYLSDFIADGKVLESKDGKLMLTALGEKTRDEAMERSFDYTIKITEIENLLLVAERLTQ